MARVNRNNQPTFTVPVAAFRAADVPPFIPGGYAYPSHRDGRYDGRTDDHDRYTAAFASVRFGARVGALIAATPADARDGVIVATVATQRRIGRTIAGRGRCDMVAYVAATGGHDDARTIADTVRTTRAALRSAAGRAAAARRMIADASADGGPGIAAAADTTATADDPPADA